MTLQRLVLDFRTGELVVRCLYRSKGGSNPGTKTRTKEISTLAKTGLEQALQALEVSEAGAEVVGTSGFTTREDILSLPTASPRPDELREAWRRRRMEGEWQGEPEERRSGRAAGGLSG